MVSRRCLLSTIIKVSEADLFKCQRPHGLLLTTTSDTPPLAVYAIVSDIHRPPCLTRRPAALVIRVDDVR
ncbi:MAG: hypothetical protein LBI40_03045 [Treponema sp.]|nr:hypothetical protein [Treponema sp.]